MKNNQKQRFMGKSFLQKIQEMFMVISLILIVHGCTQDPVLWNVKSEEQVISDFIASNPEQYSEFGQLLEDLNLNSLLSIRGPYTMFLPTNNAMFDYYKKHGVASLSELEKKYENTDSIKILAYNHLIANEIPTGDILLGTLRDTNAIGDFLVTEFAGSDIIINKESKIIQRDIRCANGFVHSINKVIEPVTINVFDRVATNPSYSLFSEGLSLTGLKDTLQTIRFPYGKRSARTRFTILAVPDTIFHKYGIRTIDELIAHFTNQPDSITFLNNGFYRYMEYHCLGGTFYFSDLETKLYPILSYDNNILVTVDTDYKLNYNKRTNNYTGFFTDQSNYPAKNGAVHAINDILPVFEPEPVDLTFETTDYFDLKQGDYYGKYYGKWSDGRNTFAKIKWEGDFLQYYYNYGSRVLNLNADCLQMMGFWWVEITTPKIMKGSYKVSGNVWSGWADYDVYIDGIRTTHIARNEPSGSLFGEVIWEKTEEHKIKLVATSESMLFWDTVVFMPVN